MLSALSIALALQVSLKKGCFWCWQLLELEERKGLALLFGNLDGVVNGVVDGNGNGNGIDCGIKRMLLALALLLVLQERRRCWSCCHCSYCKKPICLVGGIGIVETVGVFLAIVNVNTRKKEVIWHWHCCHCWLHFKKEAICLVDGIDIVSSIYKRRCMVLVLLVLKE